MSGTLIKIEPTCVCRRLSTGQLHAYFKCITRDPNGSCHFNGEYESLSGRERLEERNLLLTPETDKNGKNNIGVVAVYKEHAPISGMFRYLQASATREKSHEGEEKFVPGYVTFPKFEKEKIIDRKGGFWTKGGISCSQLKDFLKILLYKNGSGYYDARAINYRFLQFEERGEDFIQPAIESFIEDMEAGRFKRIYDRPIPKDVEIDKYPPGKLRAEIEFIENHAANIVNVLGD